jgi:hypothetical protein
METGQLLSTLRDVRGTLKPTGGAFKRRSSRARCSACSRVVITPSADTLNRPDKTVIAFREVYVFSDLPFKRMARQNVFLNLSAQL